MYLFIYFSLSACFTKLSRAYCILQNIPRAYTLYKKGNLPAKVFLRDRYGNLWTVDVEKIGNELFLVGGWSTFVLENSLELGDFVVFEPGSHNTFNVKILGKNSVEKVGLGVCKSKIKIEEEESAEEEDGEEEEESAGSAEEEDEEEDIVILSCKCELSFSIPKIFSEILSY